MLELFNQYVLIHCTAFNIHHQDLLLQITGDGYAMISSDFFTFGGEHDDVLRALKEAVANKTVLVNQEG